MIGLSVQITDNTAKVADATEKATFRNVGHAAAAIRNTAIESIIPSDNPSRPGTPPHTRNRVSRKGKRLKGQLQRAIVFFHDKDKQEAVIGPRESVVGTSGRAHEMGGEYKGQTFDERPFMGPALRRNEDRFADSFSGSIGE